MITYEQKIRSLKNSPRFTKEELLIKGFNLLDEGDLRIYYAPFDYVNTHAKIVIVGITPGWTQMQKSYQVVKDLLIRNESWETALQEVKKQASFAGTMRKNLIMMLDDIGLNKKLALSSCSEFYGAKNALIHSTSFLKYPVFYREKNYKGNSPSALRSPLWSYVECYFIEEINQFRNVLIIPLGQSVKDVISKLRDEGKLNKDHVYLENFPHPSGLNGHRHRQFASYRETLAHQISSWEL